MGAYVYQGYEAPSVGAKADNEKNGSTRPDFVIICATCYRTTLSSASRQIWFLNVAGHRPPIHSADKGSFNDVYMYVTPNHIITASLYISAEIKTSGGSHITLLGSTFGMRVKSVLCS